MLTDSRRKLIKLAAILFLLAASRLWGRANGLPPAPALAAPTELFFSEYVEGSATNQALEIFNGTGAAIDLSGYTVELYLDGNPTPGPAVILSGTLAGGAVLVLAHSGADPAILAVAGLLHDGVTGFNGDDTLVLRKGAVIVDVIGQIGSDPGLGWGSSPTRTWNQTLRRKPAIEAGDTDGSNLFAPALEWDGFPLDSFDDLGQHQGPTPPTPTPTPTLPSPPAMLAVVINEVAWGGTAANASDEWLELLNTTAQPIDLTGWVITSTNGLNIPLAGQIEPNGFYLIERSDDNTISDIPADLAVPFGSGLANGGDSLFLSAPGGLVDTANGDGGGWPGGTGAPAYRSLERIDPLAPDTDGNWQGNDTTIRNGLDAAGVPLNGTPRQPNSSGSLPATPTPTATSSPPPPTPTPTGSTPPPSLTPPPPTPTLPPSPAMLTVVINEVAWGGTAANASDEWLELLNTTAQPIDLTGWVITSTNGLNIPLAGQIEANGFYLIERSDDNTISDIPADLAVPFGSGLANSGDSLFLSAPGGLVDTANGDGGGWPGGTGAPAYRSLERVDPLAPDTDGNWQGNDTTIRNGLDAAGASLNGTPRQPNSSGSLPPPPTPTPLPPPPPPLTVVINEVAWAGTAASSADEWLELLNTTTSTLSLAGWVITSSNGLNLSLDNTVIEANGYYLIERTDDQAVSDIAADLVASFGSGLANGGETLFLSSDGVIIDTANLAGGGWPAGTAGPGYFSMERIEAGLSDTPPNWESNNGVIRNGLDAGGNPINGTPRQPNPPPQPLPPPAAPILIGELLYDGLTPSTEGDEFVELCNPNPEPVDLAGYKVGDEESQGGGESMVLLPEGTSLAPDTCLVIAKDAAAFLDRFGFTPDLQMDDLSKYTAWGRGSWTLANPGDEVLVLGPDDQVFDSLAYGQGNYPALGLEGDAVAPQPLSLQRVWAVDTASMPHDFVRADPTPGEPTVPPPPPAEPVPPAALPEGMFAYWGQLHAYSSYGEGAGPPYYALALARAAGLHFYGISDAGSTLSPLEWTKTLSQAAAATVPGHFVALSGVEWDHDQAGTLNIFNSPRLLQPTEPLLADLAGLYSWLAANPGAVAQFNATGQAGTFADFAFHPGAAQGMTLLEIGGGLPDEALDEPGFVQSNLRGWRVAPALSGQTRTALWGTDVPARTGLVAPALTEAELLAALRARRIFATEDPNLALGVRLDGAWMGSVLTPSGPLRLQVDWVDPDSEPVTLQLYDNNLSLVTIAVAAGSSRWNTTLDPLPGHAYWVKLTQADGDRAYSAPIWIEGQAPAETIFINEILPAPIDRDWDGNGQADHLDEWLEFYNALPRQVGLGGWQLRDAAGVTYKLPLGLSIPAGGFLTLYRQQTGLSLNNGAETVSLIHPNGQLIDSFSYQRSPGYDESWCRLPDGQPTWSDDCEGSPDAPNRARQRAAPLEVSIYEAKRLTHGAWVRVKGRVTAPPGLFGARTMYIQDETSGIMIYLPRDHRQVLYPGDKIELEGNLRNFREEAEIAVSSRGDIDFIEPGLPPPPLPIETTMMLEPFEGMLVMLRGQAVRFQGRTTFWVDDGTDPAKVFIRQSTGIRKPFIKPGTPLTVVGIVSQYSEAEPSRTDYRLLPRFSEDLQVAEAPALSPEAEWPALLPETGN